MPRPTKKKNQFAFLRWLVLLPIPIIWCLLDYNQWVVFFENRTIDWRFIARGEIPAPVKVVYINVDSRSLEEVGNMPWTRDIFAMVAEALITEGKAKAVGFDFVISPTGIAQSADQKALWAGDRALASYIYKLPPNIPPPVVFAASYAAAEFRSPEGKVLHRELPIMASERRPLGQIEAPEVTEFEFLNADGQTTRRIEPNNVALIDTIYGGTRTVPMWVPTNKDRTYFTLSAELCRLFWGLPQGSIKVTGDSLEFVHPDGTLHASVPMYDGQMVDINWFSRWESEHNPQQSIANVYLYSLMLKEPESPEETAAAKEFFAQDGFKDAIVLVGPTDKLLQDVAYTPVDGNQLVPRVSVHGNMIKTMMSGLYLQRLPEIQRFGIVFILTLVVSVFGAAGGAGGLRSKLAAALILTAYIYLAFQMFSEHHLLLPVVAPLGSIFTTTFTAIGWQLIQEERQKGRIKGLFGTYLAPELVNRMVEAEEDPQLGGHEEVITAYFSDIQSFSTFSEKMSPALLVELMNEYLTACTDIVQEEGGTLDKYIGDAVVAIFGAPVSLPDHAYRACVTTLRVQAKLDELRPKWKAEGKWPEVVHNLRARLGLNTGSAIIGNMGSRTRFSYTMMGDNVNLAARMESGAKAYGVYVMVTDSTKTECEKHGGDRIVFRYLDKIVVKGRSLPVAVYEAVGFKETVSEKTRECLATYAKAVERYLAQDWDAAETLFQASAPLEPCQPHAQPGIETNPSVVMIERCAYMRAHPPGPGWDGRYVMKEK